MADRLETILEEQLASFRRVFAMLSTGTMTTRSNGRDTTDETKREFDGYIRNLEEALKRHRSRNNPEPPPALGGMGGG